MRRVRKDKLLHDGGLFHTGGIAEAVERVQVVGCQLPARDHGLDHGFAAKHLPVEHLLHGKGGLGHQQPANRQEEQQGY